MSRRLITILIIGQVLIDIAMLGYIWSSMAWQGKVTEILSEFLKQSI